MNLRILLAGPKTIVRFTSKTPKLSKKKCFLSTSGTGRLSRSSVNWTCTDSAKWINSIRKSITCFSKISCSGRETSTLSTSSRERRKATTMSPQNLQRIMRLKISKTTKTLSKRTSIWSKRSWWKWVRLTRKWGLNSAKSFNTRMWFWARNNLPTKPSGQFPKTSTEHPNITSSKQSNSCFISTLSETSILDVVSTGRLMTETWGRAWKKSCEAPSALLIDTS